jgi:hypothetical protein
MLAGAFGPTIQTVMIPRQSTDRCAESGPELHRSTAQVGRDRLAEGDAATVDVEADQFGRGPGVSSEQAAVGQEMLKLATPRLTCG